MSKQIWKHLLFFIAFLCVAGIYKVQAQYSFDALRLTHQVPGQDPHSMALGSSSVSQLQGFGSYLINPAVAAKMPASNFSAGIGIRDVSQESTYIGQKSTFDENQTGLTHIGLAYKFPTFVGSLVLGGGYVQTSDYNSAFTINAFNNLTSRTYQFLTDYTGDIAFNTFAIDDLNGQLTSVFDFGDFWGVDQFAETTLRGQSGEYSMFLATEFQENFFIGLSVGVPVSRSRFQQIFIEDAPLDNAGQRLYSGEGGTGTYNIDRVLFEEKIRVDAIGLNARAGLLFSGLPMVDLGISYTSGTRWNIEEQFDAFIQTRFLNVVTLDGEVLTDNGGTFGPVLSDNISGDYSYSVTTPSRMHAGASTKDLRLASLSVSAERINYSGIRLRDFDAVDREIQIEENNFINEHFRDVWNFRAGAAITAFESVEPRIGWAWMSNPVKYIEENNRQYLSAGLGVGLNQRMSLDFAVQYGFWETTEDLYSVDASTGIIVDENTNAPVTFIETAVQNVDRIHAMAGLRIHF